MNHKSLHIHEIPVFRNRRKCFFISILEMLLLHRHIYLFSFFYIFEIFSPSLGQHGGGRGRPWSALDGRVVIIIFNDHLDGTDAVVAPLQTFYIVCVMGVILFHLVIPSKEGRTTDTYPQVRPFILIRHTSQATGSPKFGM